MYELEEKPLKYVFLSDSEADRLYVQYPDLGKNPEEYCPTCSKSGSFEYKGISYECDCQWQLQLYKHYLNAGIGVQYLRLTWDDFTQDVDSLKLCKNYVQLAGKLVSQGKGIMLLGEYGVGKTMLVSLVLKELVKLGYSCFSTTYTGLLDLYTAGWKSLEEQHYFTKKIDRTRCLFIDDLGKERETRSGMQISVLDDILRERMQQGRPTFLTTNLNTEQLRKYYGEAIYSLLFESMYVQEVKGRDYRKQVAQRDRQALATGDIAPIV